MEIRQASLEDIEGLVEAFEAYRIWYRKEADAVGAKMFLSERIKNKESVIYVAVEEQKILGFTQLYPLFSSTRMKRLWLLNDLFVHQDQRGKGISKLLIEAAKTLCRDTGACAVMLETEISNEIGNKLYPSIGFELNTSHNFYEWSC